MNQGKLRPCRERAAARARVFMSSPQPPRLIAFHVAADPPDPSVRAALAAAEVLHEPRPLEALSHLGCREIAARSRGVWGLGRAERFAIIVAEDDPASQQLLDACARHLPEVELWRVRHGSPVRVARPAASSAKASNQGSQASVTPSSAPQRGDSGRVVSAEEIRMLLGDEPAEPEGKP